MRAKASKHIWEELEKGLGSVGKIRILREMAEKHDEYFTKYALEKATGLKPIHVRRCLKALVELGWVKEFPCDPKTYRINMENGTVKIVAQLFRRLVQK
jgi:DNA-binding IclR family transcriptional regulator